MPEQGSSEWLKARAGKIRASDCLVWEGKHPYLTTQEAVRREVRALSGADSEFVMVPAVQHGTDTEPAALACLEREQGYKITATGLVVHPEHNWLAGSPDGLVGLDGMVEAKCPYPKWTRVPYSIFDKKKLMYLYQVYLGMEVTDTDWTDFICYLSDDVFKIERVERHPDFLGEEVSARTLPNPRKGKVRRLDLFHEWFNEIQNQFQDPSLQRKHLQPIANEEARLVRDEDMDKLSRLHDRLLNVTNRIADETEIITLINKQIGELKNVIADRYESSVTNGSTTLKLVNKTPPIDFKTAFEFIGGESILLNKFDKDIEDFRRETGARQIQIKPNEERV